MSHDQKLASLSETISWHKTAGVTALSIAITALVIPPLKLLFDFERATAQQPPDVKELLSTLERRLVLHESAAILLVALLLLGWLAPALIRVWSNQAAAPAVSHDLLGQLREMRAESGKTLFRARLGWMWLIALTIAVVLLFLGV